MFHHSVSYLCSADRFLLNIVISSPCGTFEVTAIDINSVLIMFLVKHNFGGVHGEIHLKEIKEERGKNRGKKRNLS